MPSSTSWVFAQIFALFLVILDFGKHAHSVNPGMVQFHFPIQEAIQALLLPGAFAMSSSC